MIVLLYAVILFQESRQIMCFTLLFGLASDEESLVRASAARALGVFVLFAALRKVKRLTCTRRNVSIGKVYDG